MGRQHDCKQLIQEPRWRMPLLSCLYRGRRTSTPCQDANIETSTKDPTQLFLRELALLMLYFLLETRDLLGARYIRCVCLSDSDVSQRLRDYRGLGVSLLRVHVSCFRRRPHLHAARPPNLVGRSFSGSQAVLCRLARQGGPGPACVSACAMLFRAAKTKVDKKKIPLDAPD